MDAVQGLLPRTRHGRGLAVPLPATGSSDADPPAALVAFDLPGVRRDDLVGGQLVEPRCPRKRSGRVARLIGRLPGLRPRGVPTDPEVLLAGLAGGTVRMEDFDRTDYDQVSAVAYAGVRRGAAGRADRRRRGTMTRGRLARLGRVVLLPTTASAAAPVRLRSPADVLALVEAEAACVHGPDRPVNPARAAGFTGRRVSVMPRAIYRSPGPERPLTLARRVTIM